MIDNLEGQAAIKSLLPALKEHNLHCLLIMPLRYNNAFKFASQGEIRLEATVTSSATVEISVTDTGIGIELDKQDTNFDAFVQEDSSIRRRYGGTGLGLTICKQLVELMEGEISLKSKGRNCGTTVTITLAAT